MKKYNIKTMEKFKLNAVGEDASVRLRKNQNRNNIITFDKHKSNVVGVGVPDDPQSKYKYINKPMSNEISKYYNTFLKIEKDNKTGRSKDAQPLQVIKSNFGITLIALIITIIVLLILTGVTLNMVMGENGIIAKAQLAKEKTNAAQNDEEQKIFEISNQMYDIIDRSENNNTFTELFSSENGSHGTDISLTDSYKNYKKIQIFYKTIANSNFVIDYQSVVVNVEELQNQDNYIVLGRLWKRF